MILLRESIVFYSIKIFGVFIRMLPLRISLSIGKSIGWLVYSFDVKHKTQAYANIKIALSDYKTPREIRKITKKLFTNFGQNLIELMRMPSMNPDLFKKLVEIEGQEHVEKALKEKGKGVLLLAMHYGSWEMASLSCAMLGFPYKMMVKPQNKYSRMDELLNSYRACGGYVTLTRGMGTRDMIKSLKNNEVIGMVTDQGGKTGVSVPFFKRDASMSMGAIRLGLKLDVPICFVVISREEGGKHKMKIEAPLELDRTESPEVNIETNLKKVVKKMEGYIVENPSEYMWFYKIWKYSKQSNIAILDDGRVGHLRQAQLVAQMVKEALLERGIIAQVSEVNVKYKSELSYKLLTLVSLILSPFFFQGRLGFLRWFLEEESYRKVTSANAEFLISCGSRSAPINYFLSRDFNAKSISVLTPSILGFNRFDSVVLPRHDIDPQKKYPKHVVVTNAAPNVISDEYLEEQSQNLLSRYSHLKEKMRFKIGVFIGGDAKNIYIGEDQIRVLCNQLREVAKEINADLIISTSRRTPKKIESILISEFRKDPTCPLLIIANKDNVPEAVGGILGLSDIIVVSGDSISMVSEAISAGKKTIVFSVKEREKVLKRRNKHKEFIDTLNLKGYLLSTQVKNVGRGIYDMSKNKIYTRKINDSEKILQAMRDVI